jgi:alpha-tubulin suppressor-like RCC1 family protein
MWGNAEDGELGIKDLNVKTINIPTKIELPGPVNEVDLGAWHSIVLLKDGSLYSFGDNRFKIFFF